MISLTRFCVPIVVIIPMHVYAWSSAVTLESIKQNISSALSVATKQTSVSSNQVGEASLNTYKNLATAQSTIDMSNRVIDAVVDYGTAFGQAQSNSCQAALNTGYNLQSKQLAKSSQNILIQNYVNNRYVDPMEGDSRLFANHKSNYCTISESQSGLCKLTGNGMQGWDSNYSGFSSAKTLAPEAELAGYSYAAMVTDQSMSVVTNCNSSDCFAVASSQLQTTSINSLVASALIGQVTDRRIPEIKESQ